jgi:hypothetical protein
MPARYQEQAGIAFEEKAAGIGQQLLMIESRNACGGQKKRFDHWQVAMLSGRAYGCKGSGGRGLTVILHRRPNQLMCVCGVFRAIAHPRPSMQ